MFDPQHAERQKFDVAMGRRLSLARKERTLTHAALALELDLFPEDIVNFESGRSPIPTHLLPELCSILEKPLSYWLDEIGYVARPKLVAANSNEGAKRT